MEPRWIYQWSGKLWALHYSRAADTYLLGVVKHHMNDLIELRDAIRSFALERDWDQFHSPKNLATALAVEAAELLEPFQWLTDDESLALSTKTFDAVRKEMADVLLYLVRLADKLDVDLMGAARDKISENALKYPVEKARGSATKYKDL